MQVPYSRFRTVLAVHPRRRNVAFNPDGPADYALWLDDVVEGIVGIRCPLLYATTEEKIWCRDAGGEDDPRLRYKKPRSRDGKVEWM